MKKLMFGIAIALTAVANADVTWSWWLENKSANTDISLGIAARCAKVETFELSLLYGGSAVQSGIQWSFWGINDSNKAQVLQLAPWFNRGDDACVQLGFVNVAKDNVFNLGFVNITDRSKVQLGLLNFNKNGFLPIFPFINIDKSLLK